MKLLLTLAVSCLVLVAARRPVPAPKKPKGGIGLCDIRFDCDKDSDCKKGLVCADARKKELKKAGLDERIGTCPRNPKKPWNWELCYKPPTSGGGGDPHFKTYDGTMYSYHGECDLVMARSATFGEDLGLDLHIRTEIVTGWSLISNAAIRIGRDIFEVSNDGSIYFNNAKVSHDLPQLAGKYAVTMTKDVMNEVPTDVYKIDLGNDEFISITNFKKMLAVRVNALLPGTEGMLGIHGKTGMIVRDGVTAVSDANEMGAAWQVTDTEPMLFHEIRAPQYPTQCKLPVVDSRRLRISDGVYEAAEAACADVEEGIREFCVDDVVRTGDNSVAVVWSWFLND